MSRLFITNGIQQNALFDVLINGMLTTTERAN